MNLRAVEIAKLMSEQPLQKANTYASKCGKWHLLDKISNIKPADWSGLRNFGQIQLNRDVQTDLNIPEPQIASQRDLFEDSQSSNYLI